MLKIILFIIIILIIMSPYFLFRFLFSKPKRSKKIPKYYIGTPHYIVSRKGMAYMQERSYQDVTITSRDGLKLHAYYFPCDQQTKKFVIGVHGYRSYAKPECGPYVQYYHSLGYNMLMVDDRAHAPSEGQYIGFGVLDRLDCVDWTHYLVNEYGEDIDILLHGVSMGGATVLSASGEDNLPVQVKGIISDCGYSSPWEILSYQLEHMMHLPVRPLLPLCEKICQKKAGFNFHDVTALKQVQKAKVPILFVQGTNDQMVPEYMAHDLYEACASPKRLLIVKDAGHGESIAFEPDHYHQAIEEHFHIQ